MSEAQRISEYITVEQKDGFRKFVVMSRGNERAFRDILNMTEPGDRIIIKPTRLKLTDEWTWVGNDRVRSSGQSPFRLGDWFIADDLEWPVIGIWDDGVKLGRSIYHRETGKEIELPQIPSSGKVGNPGINYAMTFWKGRDGE